jgi:protein-L-isoaspartate O-methyltransferase
MTATVPLRQRLVNHLVEQGMIRSPWVRQAFADTPREVFVPRFRRRYPDHGMVDGADPGQVDVWIENVYTDQVLVVQVKPARDGATAPTSSSSEPTVMAGMLEALDLRPGHRVLEIGTGTGYNAALLCHRVGAANLTSIELDPALASAARDALASIGLHPRVHVDATRADSPTATASTGTGSSTTSATPATGQSRTRRATTPFRNAGQRRIEVRAQGRQIGGSTLAMPLGQSAQRLVRALADRRIPNQHRR